MAEVKNELIYEVLRKMQGDIVELKLGRWGIRQELISIRGHMLSMQSGIHTVSVRLDCQDDRSERIHRRPELRELAEHNSPYEPPTP